LYLSQPKRSASPMLKTSSAIAFPPSRCVSLVVAAA
jgi:hypothetical protein